jgi:hypothetical protein
MTTPPVANQPVRRSRKGLYIPLVLFALVCLGWTGVWFYARGKTLDAVDQWMAREAAAGRTWSCPERGASGYPFRLQISCVAPTFVSEEPGRAGQGSLASFSAQARISDPRHIIAEFGAPLRWTARTGETLEMTFERLRASYRAEPGAVGQISVEMDKPAADWRAAGREPLAVRAAKTEFHLRRSPGTEIGTDLALSAANVELPVLNALSGETGVGAIDVRATLAKLTPAPARDWRQTLEEWRLANGEARIERLNLSKGPISLTSTGALRLDEFRRLEGIIEGQAAGLTQLLARFGVNMGGGAGGLLGALLGGGNRQQPEARPRPVPVSIRFDNGRVFFGPLPGPRLQPLY